MSSGLNIFVSIISLLLAFYALNRVTDSYFVESLESLSKRMRLTSDIAGASLMAMGSSAPELFTSLLALIKHVDLAELGAGTIVGSALFNILVIVGATALVGKAVLNWQPAVRDLIFYLASIGLLYMAFVDGQVTMMEALTFVGFYLVYLIALPVWRKIFPYEDPYDNSAEVSIEKEEEEESNAWYWLWCVPIDWFFKQVMPDLNKRPDRYLSAFLISILFISLLSWVLVEAGVVLALELGVPESMIGLTVLAVGTSVPDLMASVIVARQGKGDMAVSNAVGSNIFDILVGLGLVWVIMIGVNGKPIPISTSELSTSITLLLSTVGALLIGFLLTRWRIGPSMGAMLVGLYFLYVGAALAGWL